MHHKEVLLLKSLGNPGSTGIALTWASGCLAACFSGAVGLLSSAVCCISSALSQGLKEKWSSQEAEESSEFTKRVQQHKCPLISEGGIQYCSVLCQGVIEMQETNSIPCWGLASAGYEEKQDSGPHQLSDFNRMIQKSNGKRNPALTQQQFVLLAKYFQVTGD